MSILKAKYTVVKMIIALQYQLRHIPAQLVVIERIRILKTERVIEIEFEYPIEKQHEDQPKAESHRNNLNLKILRPVYPRYRHIAGHLQTDNKEGHDAEKTGHHIVPRQTVGRINQAHYHQRKHIRQQRISCHPRRQSQYRYRHRITHFACKSTTFFAYMQIFSLKNLHISEKSSTFAAYLQHINICDSYDIDMISIC